LTTTWQPDNHIGNLTTWQPNNLPVQITI